MSKEIFKYDMSDLSCQSLGYFFHNKVNDNNISEGFDNHLFSCFICY